MDVDFPKATMSGTSIKDPEGHCAHVIKGTRLDQASRKGDWELEPYLGDGDTSWPHPWDPQNSA